jgi:two-component system KDP operon response regulator KdpE
MSLRPRILAVDDEAPILRLLHLTLGEHYQLSACQAGQEAIEWLQDHRPDLLLIDLRLPDMDGRELLRNIRRMTDAPVIVLSGLDTDAEKVRALDAGADDYVVKPFNADELQARIQAVLRRASVSQSASFASDGLKVDFADWKVTRDGQDVELTRTEWALLGALAENAGRVCLSEELLSTIWGPAYVNDVQYLRVWVSRLRQKLERDPEAPTLISTHHGLGYSLKPA